MNPPSNLVQAWIRICQNNLWFRGLPSSHFGARLISPCATIDELHSQMSNPGQPAGRTFSFENLCFLHPAKGQDEWIGIKDETLVTTIHFRDHLDRDHFRDYIRSLQDTPEQRLRKSLRI